jgi:tripartite-type tricarboxylate transporter receptor subunit TctC
MPRWRLGAILLSACAVLASLSLASGSSVAAEPFYKGKRLTVMVNFAPGGSTDIEGRLFARHVAKYIEGQPAVVVQNMDGAGGLNGTNYVGEIAPKDGTVVGFLGGAAWQYASDPERHRVDLRTYEFIAYQPGTTVYYVRSDVAPGMKEPADIVKAQGLIAGGNGAHNARDLIIRLTLDILGVPHKYVTGFRSGQTVRLALQRGEVNFFAEPASAYRGAVVPQLVKSGIAIPVYFDPTYNGEKLSISKQADGLDLLPFQELYKKVKGAMGRVVALPPGAPPEAVAAMRTAVERLNHDKAYAEDSAKAIGFAPEFEAGPDTNRQVRQALVVSPEIRAFVADYIKKAGK